MYSTSKLDAEKEPIQVQLAGARWRVLSNYSGTTRTTVQLLYEWRVQMYNYGSNQGCWWPIRFENFDIVMIIIIIVIIIIIIIIIISVIIYDVFLSSQIFKFV